MVRGVRVAFLLRWENLVYMLGGFLGYNFLKFSAIVGVDIGNSHDP